MPFDTTSPEKTHEGLADIDQIREDLNQLRSNEEGSTEPSSLVAGQLFTTGIVCEYLVRIYYGNDSRKPYSVAETTLEK